MSNHKIILLSLIDDGENLARETAPGKPQYSSIEELADMIEANDYVEEITVRKSGVRYKPVAGSRRVRALRILVKRNKKWEKVPCLVLERDDKSLDLINIASNVRDDGPQYAFIMACQKFRHTHKMSVKEIAKHTGKTERTVSDAIAMAEKLHPTILMAVKNGQPIARDKLVQWSAKPADVQLKEYERSTKGRSSAQNKRIRGPRMHISREKMEALRDEYGASAETEHVFAAAVLSYLLGEGDKP